MKIIYILLWPILAAQPCFGAIAQDIILVPEGKVEARTAPDSEWMQVENQIKLAAGAEIRTGKDSKAGILFPDGSRFILDNNTLFSVESTDKRRAGFQLKLGRLKAAVAGYFSSRFEVKTPAAVCAVRGTAFDMEVADDGRTEMNVSEGLVEVNDSKGAMAVVSSEERINIGMDGMTPPETVSLNDERAGDAARPMAVRQETARERTRTMLEEVRNRELKANESQLGKDSIDAFGKRVRIEEYLLKPTDKEFKLLFLCQRPDEGRLDWGHVIERFQNKIPDDLSQIKGLYSSISAPSNWLKYFEIYLTNTVDSVKETIDFGNPVLVDFSGYAGAGSRYYPSYFDHRQILSGPGVVSAPGAGVGTGLNSDERLQFRSVQDYNLTTAARFTWTQMVVNASGALSYMYQSTLDPTSAADVANMGTDNFYDPTIDVVTTELRPSNLADYTVSTLYADGSIVSSRKLQVSNYGEILGVATPANSETFLKEGSFNTEMIVASNLFQGRNIDVVIGPSILLQKKDSTTEPGVLTIQ